MASGRGPVTRRTTPQLEAWDFSVSPVLWRGARGGGTEWHAHPAGRRRHKEPWAAEPGPQLPGGGTPRTSPCAPLIWLFTHVLPNIFSSTGELFPKLRCKLPNRVGVVTSGLQPVTQKHRRHAGVRGGGGASAVGASLQGALTCGADAPGGWRQN